MARAYNVVDADGHILEPLDLWDRSMDRLSACERAMLMGGVCAKAYGWSPKKG